MQHSDSAAFYNTIARYYDAENEHMIEDFAFYSAIAEAHGAPILEIGCGTGRVTFHLASEGYLIDGIDYSRAMLDRAERRLQSRADLRDAVRFFMADARSFTTTTRYKQILFPYNCLMHFQENEAHLAVLKNLARLLHPDGVMVFDLPNAGEAFAAAHNPSINLERTFLEPESGNLVMQQSVSNLNRTTQIQEIIWIYDEIQADGTLKRTLAPLTLRYIFPAELDLLLQLAGMKRLERYGDYESNPFEEGSQRLIVLAGLR
ncbi:MAG: class I SAM-dependent methyltransferase [Anaerolineae bacterium]